MEKRVDDVKMILLEAWCPFEDFGSNVYDNEGHMVLHGYRDDTWTVAIDKEAGRIIDWPVGMKANVYFKVRDECALKFLGKDSEAIAIYEGYVPDFLSPLEDGFGDYINLDINEYGLIKGWNKDDVTAFLEQLPDKAFQMK